MNTILPESKSLYELVIEDYNRTKMTTIYSNILDNIKRTYTLSRNTIISIPEIYNNLLVQTMIIDINRLSKLNKRSYLFDIEERTIERYNITISNTERMCIRHD